MADAKKRRVDTRDLTVLIGLVALTAGAWNAIGPSSLALPGAVLVWYALPPRPPFVSSK